VIHPHIDRSFQPGATGQLCRRPIYPACYFRATTSAEAAIVVKIVVVEGVVIPGGRRRGAGAGYEASGQLLALASAPAGADATDGLVAESIREGLCTEGVSSWWFF
jgi:hypothetical protein